MKKLRVLLADDHAIIRDGLKQILADTEDLAVAGEASNGLEVMQQVRENDWDVLVLDISMPGRSGLELIHMIKAEKPELPILILSMHNEEQYAVRAFQAGAMGYVTKESDGDVFVSAIRRVAKGGVYISDKVAELMVRGIRPAQNALPHNPALRPGVPDLQYAGTRAGADRNRRRTVLERQDDQHPQDPHPAKDEPGEHRGTYSLRRLPRLGRSCRFLKAGGAERRKNPMLQLIPRRYCGDRHFFTLLDTGLRATKLIRL